MARVLKILAKDLGVPVVVLAQLDRGSANRADKRPQLSDLRGSGAIEQDADIVMFVHRSDEPNRVAEADLIIIAKHREGPTATIGLIFQGHFSRFKEAVPGWANEPPQEA